MNSRFRLAGAVVLVAGLSVALRRRAGSTPSATSGRSRRSRTRTTSTRRASSRRPPPGTRKPSSATLTSTGSPISSWATAYDNLYKPAKAGEAENDAYLQKAVENYKLATEKIKDTDPQGPQIRKLAYEYLIATYNDKMHDLEKAEPVAKQLIAARAERAAELRGARQALRGLGPLRRSRGAVPEGRGRPAERRDRLPGARRLLQSPGQLREDDGGVEQARQRRAEQPRGLAHDRDLLRGRADARQSA